MQGTKDPIPLINLHETFDVLYTGFVFTRQDDQTGFQMEFYFRFSCPATTFNEAYSQFVATKLFYKLTVFAVVFSITYQYCSPSGVEN